MKEIFFTNVNFNGNAGDFWCTPIKYYNFDEYKINHIHFMDFWEAVNGNEKYSHLLLKDRLIVIGGGGLLTTKDDFLQRTTEYLVMNNKVIFWGVGSNTFKTPSYDILFHPNVLLAGIRDIVNGLNIDYLPCVSCKHILFDKEYETKNSIGVIEHPRHMIKIEGSPKINNQSSIQEIVNFLGSNSKIISSTYHGVYWSQLLEKEVMYYKTSEIVNSKIMNMKHRVTICDESDYLEKIEFMSSTKGMLKESRKLNDEFYKQTMMVVSDFFKIKSN